MQLNDRLRRYLAVSATLHQAKALRGLAASLRVAAQPGAAVAALADASARLRQAAVVCERDSDWRAALVPELAALEALRDACDRERRIVHFQPVAPEPPTLPPGRVIVSPLPFDMPGEADSPFFQD